MACACTVLSCKLSIANTYKMHSVVIVVLALLVQHSAARGSVFRDGDIVPTSRRAQFHGVRLQVVVM